MTNARRAAVLLAGTVLTLAVSVPVLDAQRRGWGGARLPSPTRSAGPSRQVIREQQRRQARDQERQRQRELQSARVRDMERQRAAARTQATRTGSATATRVPAVSGKRVGDRVLYSNGVAKLDRQPTPGELRRGFTGRVTADGRAIVRFQGRTLAVPATRIGIRISINPNRSATTLAATAPAWSERVRRLATAKVPPKGGATSPTGGPANDNSFIRGLLVRRFGSTTNLGTLPPQRVNEAVKFFEESGLRRQNARDRASMRNYLAGMDLHAKDDKSFGQRTYKRQTRLVQYVDCGRLSERDCRTELRAWAQDPDKAAEGGPRLGNWMVEKGGEEPLGLGLSARGRIRVELEVVSEEVKVLASKAEATVDFWTKTKPNPNSKGAFTRHYRDRQGNLRESTASPEGGGAEQLLLPTSDPKELLKLVRIVEPE